MSATMTASPTTPSAASPQRIAQTILDFLAEIPHSSELPSDRPRARSEAIALAARRKAFLASASLSLPPGPAGWLTVLPELVAIWKIQAKMVADIAAACGRRSTLTREQMLYCLFRHAAAQALRDIAVRAGERLIVRQAGAQALRTAAERIGSKLAQRALGSGAARLLPVLGAMGVGAYAWYDTRQVSRTAIDMFTREIEIVGESRSTEVPARRIERDRAQDAREAGL